METLLEIRKELNLHRYELVAKMGEASYLASFGCVEELYYRASLALHQPNGVHRATFLYIRALEILTGTTSMCKRAPS